MINKLFRTTTQKIKDVIEVLGYIPSKCSTKGCSSQAWQDGFCRDCANYMLQKETLSTFQTDYELTKNMVGSIYRIETDLASFKQNVNQPFTKDNSLIDDIESATKLINTSKSKAKKLNKENNTFIPNIEIEQKAQLLKPEISDESRDINKLAKKLKATQHHGENGNE